MRITLLLTLLLTSILAFAADNTTEVFTLDHQMSQHCEKRIKENLRFEKGISNIEISLKENTITITYDRQKTDVDKILKAFKKIGFNAFVVGDCDDTHENKKTADICPDHDGNKCSHESQPAACH